MKDEDRTKEQLINELVELRQRIAELEKSETLHKRAEKTLQIKTENLQNLSTKDVRSLIHELQVHQTELEMQKEELRRTQSELEEARNRYADLYDFAPIGYFIFNKNGLILEVNLTGANKLGVERSFLIKKPFSQYIVEDSKDTFYLHLRKVFGTNTKQTCEIKLVDKNGVQFDALFESLVVQDRNKSIQQCRTAVSDVTKYKQAEELLHDSEARYRNLIESARDVIFTISPQGMITSLNPAFETATGWSRDEWLNKNFAPIVHPDDLPLAIEIFQRSLKREITPSFELRILSKSGDYLTFEFTITLQIQDVKVVNGLGIARNITERKKADEALQQSEEKHRTLIENIQDGVFIIQDAKIQFANEAFARIAGYTMEEVIGKDFRELVAPEDLEIITDRYRRRQAGEDVPKEYEFHGILKDGTRTTVNMNVGLITYRGRVASMGTVKDITEKKRLESQLLRAQRMESIGTLASGITHDINNVLSPIVLSLQMLKEKFTDKQSQKLINILERSAHRGAGLIKQVQSFAKGIEGERVTLQVAHIVSEIVQMIKETFPKSIEIKIDIPKDLWTISGDATQLHQVIMNLCVNARDAMPDGGILNITASNFYVNESYARMNIEAKVGRYIIITVSDTGTGIPSEILDKIFEPFFTTKGLGKGTGLGLSTSLGIVKSHEGFITVDSEVGKGTTFKVYLPAIKTEIQEAGKQELKLPVGNGELILITEDEGSIREITRSTLEAYGYKVLTAEDGAQAAALYAQNKDKINVVLMDMMMPVMDGQASIQSIRKINPEVKIIAVSGLVEKEKFANIADHVNAFLTKPYTAEKLLKTIHDVLSMK